MKCPHCGEKNFKWASKCDHCGHSLDGQSDTAVNVPAIAHAPDAGHVAVDVDALHRQEFLRTLAARTPRVFVTFALIAMNVAVFLAMVAGRVSPTNPGPEALITWGASFGPLITHGQWWRLLTALFIHIGVIHLLMNMYVLWIIGTFTERLFGHVGLSVLYLLSGLAAGLTSLVWHPQTVSAGASGAIFGLYGGLLGFLLLHRHLIPAELLRTLSINCVTFVMVNVLYGLASEHIDLAAHLGGFVGGIPVGCALAIPVTASLASSVRRSFLVAAAGAALAGAAAVRLPVVDDLSGELKHLAALEHDNLSLYSASLDKARSNAITRDEFANVVNATILPAWEAERTKIAALRVPEPQHTRARQVAEYMALRAEAWRLSAEAIRTNDATLARNATLKQEAALVALEAAFPGTAGAQIAKLRSAQTAADTFTTEMKNVAAADTSSTRLFNDSLAELKAGKISREQFAATIEKQVLPPWNGERERLSKLRAPDTQEAVIKKMVDYMRLKGEAWQLTAAAIRSNDDGLLAKALEASKRVKSIAETRSPSPH